ncbi:MAG: beta-phosphoglucomutase [Spirochaetales bacterium]|nr:beta-phosphoglucomutase [Spirochaetales bacterium]
MINTKKFAIFDLDGVIVDTAKYHYLAWKKLAKTLGFDFSESDNERLKGVSRMQSLDILLEIGGLQCTEVEKTVMADKKNQWYLEYIDSMTPAEILPGAEEYVRSLKARGLKTALGSASKNARKILDKLNLSSVFDVVVDGKMVSHTKPDPEVFLTAAKLLKGDPAECVVFEDAEAGIEAAKRAGMYAVGIGKPEVLPKADIIVSGLQELFCKNLCCS